MYGKGTKNGSTWCERTIPFGKVKGPGEKKSSDASVGGLRCGGGSGGY